MVRSQTKLYPWGNMSRSITSLLGEKRIFNLVPGNTYGSKREAIRSMLEKVKSLPDLGRTSELTFVIRKEEELNFRLREQQEK